MSPDDTIPNARGGAVILGRGVIVAILSVLLGGLTSFAQGFLPDELSSFANSSSGWTVLTVALVFWSRFHAPYAAVAAAVSFVLLVFGYAAVSEARGLFYDPLRWSVIGVFAGPFIGVATAWLREHDIRASLGVGLLSGVLLGDAIHGLAVVGETTSPVYWVLIGLVGLGLLGFMLARKIRGALPVAVALAETAAAAGMLLLGYQVIGAIYV